MLIHRLQKLLGAMEAPLSVIAALTWPKFSLSAVLIAARLRRHGVRPATVIDAGANEGQFALAVAQAFPDATIHSFEPDPAAFQRLRRNVRALARVHAHEMALGDRRERRPFHVNVDSQVSSLLPASEERTRAFPHAVTKNTVMVEVDTLGQFFDGRELARPVLLKLDVQGYEHLVLEGAGPLLANVDYVLAETAVRPLYDGEASCEQIIGYLSRLGFMLDKVADWHHAPGDGAVIELDLLFSRRPSEPAGA